MFFPGVRELCMLLVWNTAAPRYIRMPPLPLSCIPKPCSILPACHNNGRMRRDLSCLRAPSIRNGAGGPDGSPRGDSELCVVCHTSNPCDLLRLPVVLVGCVCSCFGVGEQRTRSARLRFHPARCFRLHRCERYWPGSKVTTPCVPVLFLV